ncbi:unnamed protein product [Symbiodinium sp. CCMP2592]|nr:unnamed protein product [Symbiodinium sp. CCMP2592]
MSPSQPHSGNSDNFWTYVVDGLSTEDATFLHALAVKILLHNATGFHRRVVHPLQSFPHRLLWFTFSSPDKCCERRIALARELLNTPDASLEVNARKVKHRFQSALQKTLKSGLCSRRLYWLLKCASILWKSDVRENERLNKMVALLRDRCPNCSLDLRSARVGLKYLLGEAGEGTGKSSAKWSTFRPVAERVRHQCLEVWDQVGHVQSDPSRWHPNHPNASLTSEEVKKICNKMQPHLNTTTLRHIWAASYSAQVHKELDCSDESLPVVFVIGVKHQGQSKSSFTFWIAGEKVRNRYVVCPAQHACSRLTWRLQSSQPFVAVLKEQYDAVKAGSAVRVMQCHITELGCDGPVTSATVSTPKPLITLEPPNQAFVAQATGRKAEARDGGDDDGDVDSDTDVESGVSDETARLLHLGAAAAFDPDVIGGGNDELEEQFENRLRAEADEDLVTQHEQEAVLRQMERKEFNMDDPQQQLEIAALARQSGIDAVDAAVEIAVAREAGVSATDSPRSSGDSVGKQSIEYLANINNCPSK